MFGNNLMGEKPEKKRRFFTVKMAMIALLALSIATASIFSWTASAPSVYAASSLQDLQQQQQQIQQQQKEVAAELAQLKEDQTKQLEYKQKLDEQAANLQSEIDVRQQIINGYNQQIGEKEVEIAGVEAEIADLLEQLKERIRASYLAGEASTLEVLLNAENFFDLAEKAQVAQSIAEHDKVLIDQLVEKVNSIAAQKQEIETLKDNVAQEQSALESQKAEVQELIEEAARVLESLKAQEDEANSLAARLADEREQTEQEIDEWWQDYYASQSAGNSTAGSSSTPPTSGNGMFTWPCPGVTVITSYWGDGRNHQAIDISGNSYGKTIVASASGTVVRANKSGWGGGYGLYIMIDHGGGWATLYAHCSAVNVNVGQQVSQGQAIGKIGSTGDSSGPHLHFEVRYNGVRVDPLKYL